MPRDGIDEHHRGQFAAGQNVIANGDFFINPPVDDSLIDAFVVSAEQQEPIVLRELLDLDLIETLPAGGKVDPPWSWRLFSRTSGPIRRKHPAADFFNSPHNNIHLHHHPRSTAVRRVVDLTVLAGREITDVVRMDFNNLLLCRPLEDALGKGTRKHLREEGEDVDAHEDSVQRRAISEQHDNLIHTDRLSLTADRFLHCSLLPPALN